MRIAAVIPALNEEKTISMVINSLKEFGYYPIVVSDGSTDSTGIIAEELGAIVINHQKNQGYGAAIRSIFLKAKEIKSEVLITLDADGQHDVNDIEKILKPITNNKCDKSTCEM